MNYAFTLSGFQKIFIGIKYFFRETENLILQAKPRQQTSKILRCNKLTQRCDVIPTLYLYAFSFPGEVITTFRLRHFLETKYEIIEGIQKKEGKKKYIG